MSEILTKLSKKDLIFPEFMEITKVQSKSILRLKLFDPDRSA
jgi:hypothetical protein